MVICQIYKNGELVGIYPNKRSQYQEVFKQDIPGLLMTALNFFNPLFPDHELKGNIAFIEDLK